MGKHSPNNEEDYFNIHLATMARLEDQGLVLHDGLEIEEIESRDGWELTGIIQCVSGIEIHVRKVIRRKDNGLVQTQTYKYHVMRNGEDAFRYCSPHAYMTWLDENNHRLHHHKHVYQAGEVIQTITFKSWDDVPTLGEVIDEALKLLEN